MAKAGTKTKSRTGTGKKPSVGRKARKTIRTSRRAKKGRVLTVSWKLVTLVIVVLALFRCVPYITLRLNPGQGATLPKGLRHYGMDISHYQGEISWDSLMVLANPQGRTVRNMRDASQFYKLEYVFIKATEGETMVDSKFHSHWSSASASGLQRGAYHFFRSSKNPVAQAENFIRTVGELAEGDLPPVLDVETMHRGCTKEMLNKSVLRWLHLVEEHYGVKPIVYSSENFFRDVLGPEVKSYPMWVAHYKVPYPSMDDWTYWQFTDDAVVHGVHGKVDLSVRRAAK